MPIAARPVEPEAISRWRDLYRHEMNCQIIHDSLHVRPGWTQPFLLESSGAAVGYASMAIAGPWTGTRTIFEFYLAPQHRAFALQAFEALLGASQANGMTVQTNDPLITVMLHAWAHDITSEAILFADRLTTTHQSERVALRRRETENDWVLEIEGAVAATGGILYHYNRPYGDIYMEVTEPHRRRGLGAYLVQELKRICYELGSVPAARCNTRNVASRKTLQKAGFVPCGHILNGSL
jgi:GNAT superfamily N-acetyltransferase